MYVKIILFIFFTFLFADTPVLKNPGIPDQEIYLVKDYINSSVGFVTAQITVRRVKDVFVIEVIEDKYFLNQITVNAYDLTTIAETRTSGGKLIEQYVRKGNNIRFINTQKNIDLREVNPDRNIYSRYAYFFSLRGFPYDKPSVTFSTYMMEYGNALPMNVVNKGRVRVKVPAGVYYCNKLEISVGGWQSFFAQDKYYLYFNVNPPYQFVKFDQKVENGRWLSNELIQYKTK